MSSSMRNAIPRRSHRERAQPHVRQRRGLLEKRKDYLLRARDYKRKQTTLKRLTEKATERNPDEFYFGMVSGRTENGVPVANRPESRVLSVKEAKPLKMQDVTYIRTMRSIEQKKIERLRPLVSGRPQGNKKILFAENKEEADVLRSIPKEGIKFGKNSKSSDARELEARLAREAELAKMERQINLQVQLMGKGRAVKVRPRDHYEDEDEEKIPIYKWKPQRQK